MTKVLVSLKVKPAFAPAKAGPFVHNREHDCLLYGGEPLTVEAFNAHSAEILSLVVPYPMQVTIIEDGDKPEPAKPVEIPTQDAEQPPVESKPEPTPEVPVVRKRRPYTRRGV